MVSVFFSFRITRACATAVCASCASLMVSVFFSFSAARISVALAMAASSSATALVNSAISSVSFATDASSSSISACSVSTAMVFSLRVCSFVASSVSHQLINLCVQRLDCHGFLFARLLVRRELCVAPALVLRLLVGLLHEPHDQILDHLLHLLEGIVLDAHGQRRQHPTVEIPALIPEVLRHTLLRWAAPISAELRQGSFLGLQHRREVLLRVPRDRVTREDLDRLLDGLELFRPQLLARLKVRCLLLACRGKLSKVLLVGLHGGGGVLKLALRVRLGLQLFGLGRRLLTHVLLSCVNLRLEILHEHLECMARIHLLLLQGRPLVDELVQQLLEHFDDAVGLELVCV